METNDMKIKRKYITAISGLLLISLVIASFSSVQAEKPQGNLYSVYGFVTLNGNPAPANVTIILSIPDRGNHTNYTTAQSRYTVDFDAVQGEIANFTVYVYDQYVHPTNTPSFVITDPSPHGYFINLSVNATPLPPEPPGGGDGGDGGGETNKPPSADAGGPYQGLVGENILFDGSLSNDTDGTIVSYKWIFGDGTNGTGKTILHAYAAAGTYPVSLIVTDNDGGTGLDTTTAEITVANNPPTIPALTGGPGNSGHKNVSYDFQAMSTDADNDTIQYIFSWGDGQTFTTDFFVSGISTTSSHTWSVAGRYVISVKASDNKTESGTTSQAILIDAQYVGDYGYLIDTNGDGIYDLFYSNSTGLTTAVELQDDGTYLIDSDNDGDWDYIYEPKTKQITTYPTEGENQMISPLMVLGGILGIIAVLFLLILLLTRRKKGTPPAEGMETITPKKSSTKRPRKPAK